MAEATPMEPGDEDTASPGNDDAVSPGDTSTSEGEPATRRQYKSADERRDEIVGATLAILAEDGMHAWTTAALAERVGVSEATIFKHFSDKSEILGEAVRTQAEALRSRIRAYDGTGTRWENVAGLVRSLLDFCEETGGGPMVILIGPASQLPVNLQEELRASLSIFRERVREFLADGEVDEAYARSVADLAVAIAQSSVLRWLLSDREQRLRDIARPMLELAGQAVTGRTEL